jgi:hypothetical protein
MNQISLEWLLTQVYNNESNMRISLVEHLPTTQQPQKNLPFVKVETPSGTMLDHTDYYNFLHSLPPKLARVAKKYYDAGWDNAPPPVVGVTTRAGWRAQNR